MVPAVLSPFSRLSLLSVKSIAPGACEPCVCTGSMSTVQSYCLSCTLWGPQLVATLDSHHAHKHRKQNQSQWQFFDNVMEDISVGELLKEF